MKKVLLTLAAVAFAFAANAQFVIGGQIGFQSNGGSLHNTSVLGTTTTEYEIPATKTTDFTFLPKVGYNLADNMQVGANLGFTTSTTTNFSAPAYMAGKEDWTKVSQTSWVFAPYFRYGFGEFCGKFTAFVEAQLSLAGTPHWKSTTFNGTEAEGNTKLFDLGFSIVPGLNYAINDKFSCDLYVDLLSLNYSHRKSTTFVDASTGGLTITDEDVNVSNSFFLGCNADAQSLGAHLGWFRLGFNYHL